MEPTQGFVEVIEFKELEFYEVNNCIQLQMIITNETDPTTLYFFFRYTVLLQDVEDYVLDSFMQGRQMREFNVHSIDSSPVTMKTHLLIPVIFIILYKLCIFWSLLS
jgi:hypothetical protein